MSLFAYDEIRPTLKTYNVNKRRQDNDKKCLGIKKYGVIRLIKEFPNKKWSKRGVGDFLKRLRTTGPLNEHPVVDVVNHAIDEWRRRLSAVSTLNADILSITYDY